MPVLRLWELGIADNGCKRISLLGGMGLLDKAAYICREVFPGYHSSLQTLGMEPSTSADNFGFLTESLTIKLGCLDCEYPP